MPHHRNTHGKRGVSPVVGTILMVAIVVVLGALLAFFVTDLGNNESAAAGVTFTETTDGVEITLVDVQRADTITVIADGTELHTWNADEIGGKITVEGVDANSNIQIIGTHNDQSTMIQTHVPEQDYTGAAGSPQLVSSGSTGPSLDSPVNADWVEYDEVGNLVGSGTLSNALTSVPVMHPNTEYYADHTGNTDTGLTEVNGSTGEVTVEISQMPANTGTRSNTEVYVYAEDSTGTTTDLFGSSSSRVGVDGLSVGDSRTFNIDANESVTLYSEWYSSSDSGLDDDLEVNISVASP